MPMNRRRWIAPVAGLALSAALVGCGQAAKTASGGNATGNTDGVSGGAMLTTVAMLDNFRFQPDVIRVKQGEKVALVVDNLGALNHDFSVAKIPVTGVRGREKEAAHHMGGMKASDMALHIAPEPKAKGTLEFTATEKGTYDFFCTVPGHKDAGMKGKLIVE